ncbi:MAG: heliorhodopsin HeR [Candidatus Kerfeldbacteria bacterium]
METKQNEYKKLRPFNLVMAVFHAVQGGLMLWLSNDFVLPINTSFLSFDTETFTLFPVTETVWEVALGPLVAGFLFLSALAHLLISLPGIYQWYERSIRNGINTARWIEYAFSSSLMIVVISMLVGMYDGVTLMLIFGLNAMMILFGWMMELHNQTTKKTDWTSYVFGCIAGIIPWIAIAMYLGFSGEGDNKAPTFVYWIFFSIFLFFNTFAINQLLQYLKVGKWKKYLFGEYAYIVLSLVAKSLLAWQVFAGTLRPM